MYSNFDSNKIIKRRSFIAILLTFIFSLIISIRLFYLQIINAEKYKKKSKENRISTKITPPIRGNIYDTNKTLVAGTSSNYSFILFKYINHNYYDELLRFNKIILLSSEHDASYSKLKAFNSYSPYILIKNASWDQIVLFEKNKFLFSSIKIIESKKRYYPYKNFSQILGYLSESLDFKHFPKGAFHIEKKFNHKLKGEPGKIFNEVNSLGKIVREIHIDHPKKGYDLNLTINLLLQDFCQNQIPHKKKGSIVVMKVSDGSILSLVSKPTFNSQDFEDRNTKKINNYFSNIDNPMFNRAFSGFYPPGSVFKPLPALLGLEKNIINNDTTFFCNGHTVIDGYSKKFNCWKKRGHGKVNLKKAIKESCDVFFFELAKKIEIDDLSKLATEMGYNQEYDIGLSNMNKGLIPTRKWKKYTTGISWGRGDNLNTCIGQGYNQTSPLQLAIHYNSIINGGFYPKPKLLKNEKTIILGRKIHPDHQKILLNSLNAVVNEYGGTANKLSRTNPNYIKIAGKTGTSQVIRIKESEREDDYYKKKEILEKFKDHSIFVGFGPVYKPKYIASVVIENGGSGSSVAGPIAHEVLNFVNKLNV